MQPHILNLRNLRLADGAMADVLCRDGRIERITPPSAGPGHDCDGALLLPTMVDSHIHLDKTLLGLPFIPHRPGDSVAERIAQEKALRSEVSASVLQRGAALIEQILPYGTTALRSHVDIDTDIGLAQLEQVLELRRIYADRLTIQIVAFPQSGILRDPGTADLLDAALASGADLVGGLDPAQIDADAGAHLDVVFGLAERHGCGVDIHLHEGGPEGLATLRDIAARTGALGLQGKVAVSHAFALGEAHEIGPTVAALARAGVAIITNAPGPVPMPPVRRLADEGVLVVGGSDNIRDAWSPYGNGDMLDRAALIGYRQGLLADADVELAFRMVTDHGRQLLGLPAGGIRVGAPADLMLVEAGCLAEAVAGRAPRRLVVRNGRVLAGESDKAQRA